MARILAVHDNADYLLMMETHLTRPEFEVVTADTGAKALEETARADFDLVLLDVHLPGMDGFEVCRRLKEKDRTKAIPVIFMSGELRETAHRIEGYKTGAVDYIVKPIANYELLRARIRVMLRMQEELRTEVRRSSDLAQELAQARQRGEAADRDLADHRRLLDLMRCRERLGSGLLDGDLRLIESGGAFREVLGPFEIGAVIDGAPGTPAGALAELLRTADGEDAAAGQIEQGGRRLDVEFEWIRPGGLVVVTLFDGSEQRSVEHDLAQRQPARPRLVLAPATATGAGSYAIPGFIGSSAGLLRLNSEVDRLRHRRETVLVHGETGTGKELVSRALHYGGPDAHKPFIPIHCGAISPQLIEAELFGHVKGAFTGAMVSKEGLFTAADGGTIFLDEISETSKDLQVKLLRVLQNREVRPVGATHPLHVDVRIVAATNRDLGEMVRRGKFREDLFHRLDVISIRVPPLRERIEDIPELVEHFIARHRATDQGSGGISRGALAKLCAYSWPGNVRELENVIQRALALYPGGTVQEDYLPEKVLACAPPPSAAEDDDGPPVVIPLSPKTDGDWRSRDFDAKRRWMNAALVKAGGNASLAAQELKMPRSTFYRWRKQLGLG